MNNKIAIFALGCLTLASCGKKQGMPTGDNKHVVETLVAGQAETTTSYPATIRSRQDVNVVAKVSGHILKVFVDEGQDVKAGQPLFLIDPTLYQAAVNAAEADVKMAEASVETQRLNVENKEMNLYGVTVTGDISEKEALAYIDYLQEKHNRKIERSQQRQST